LLIGEAQGVAEKYDVIGGIVEFLDRHDFFVAFVFVWVEVGHLNTLHVQVNYCIRVDSVTS
jgi:hypothetical protein